MMANPFAAARLPWKGWPQIGQPEFAGDLGWVDVSHPITESLSRAPSFPQPVIKKIEKLPDDPANVTHVSMAVHHGTHVDAPSHFYADGPTMDQIPLERLYGRGILYRVSADAGAQLTVEEIQGSGPDPQPGDIVLIDTGWHRYMNQELYNDAPSLSVEAAEWLRDAGVKLVGIDASTPDLPAHRRTPGFDWPVHQIFLGSGVLIAEHMANLSALKPGAIEAFFGVTTFVGADAGPARVIARNIHD